MAAERRRGIRVRTTVAATAVVAVALLAGGLALVLALRSALGDVAGENAEQRVDELTQMLRAGGPDRLPSTPGEDPDDVPDVAWQVLRDGRPIASTPLGGTDVVLDPDAETVELDGDRYAVESERDGDYTVVAAGSLEAADESVEALLPLLAVGLPAALAVIAAVTWVSTGRALRPVERIRSQVETMSARELDRRLDVPATGDEIARLAVTMNAMLARLDDSASRQRQFLSDTSHELRSPLASMRQTAEVARLHPGALADGELADAVLVEGERMQDLVEQMLVLTRTEERSAGVGDDLDLDDLLWSEATRIRRIHEHLTVDTSGIGPARLHGDTAALTRVVRNLLDNAARHAHSTIAMSAVDGPAGVRLIVEDDGDGVPPEQRERVFERFVRIDDARSRDAGGSGLGLAIVREVVRAHGGEAVLERSELGGARFVIQFPPAA